MHAAVAQKGPFVERAATGKHAVSRYTLGLFLFALFSLYQCTSIYVYLVSEYEEFEVNHRYSKAE